MRKSVFAAGAALAVAALAVTSPSLAQSEQNQPTTGSIFGRVLDSLLGPEKKPAEEVTEAPQTGALTMAQVLADQRRDEDRPRDVYRHPAETLDFFQVRPGMTVVDFMPSGGWYSRVLIPYLGQQGTYIGLNPAIDADATGFFATLRDTSTKLPSQAREWVGYEGARVIGANADDIPAGLEGSADRMLIFREMHNIRRSGWLHSTALAARKLLKDDGMLGIVQHRAKRDAPYSYADGSKGYQHERDVIALMSAYGFELVARSEVNANPKDPANWENGVWTLPPTYAGARDNPERKAELAKIGESDRMTLLFRKLP